MTDPAKDPQAILAEAIKKRDELNIFIRMYQEMLGDAATQQPESGSTTTKEAARPGGGNDFDPLSVVYPGMFFGKSQPQAVHLLLDQVKPRPVPTRLLIECLEKGGLKVGGKKPAVNLWGVLNRNAGEFILVPKAGWGLVEWYEPSVIAKFRKEGKPEEENGGEGE